MKSLAKAIPWACVLGLMASCDSLERKLARVIPALEVADPELASDPVVCDPAVAGPRPTQDCVIDDIACNTVIEANTSTGANKWGDDFYVGAYCTPGRHNYDQSPESVYRLSIPPSMRATVRLDSNCADLDVVSVMWNKEDYCPHAQHLLNVCEMDVSTGGGVIQMTAVNDPITYLVGVDGKNGATGNFRLSVTCERYR